MFDPSKEKFPGSSEKGKNHEEDRVEVLHAVGKTDPSTGEKVWYTKDPNTRELTPINTNKDEEGRVREVLEDGTLGREVIQDPSDDPDRYLEFFGDLGQNNELTPDGVESQSGVLKNEFNATPEVTIATTEGQPAEHMGSNDQGNANSMRSNNIAIKKEIHDTDPSNITAESPANFSEKVTAYQEKLNTSVARIGSYLDSKAQHLKGLGMPDAGDLLAKKAHEVIATIENEVEAAGDDFSKLSEIRQKYLEGDPQHMLSQIEPMIDANSSTAGFNSVLQRTATIPELMFIADKLVTTRAIQKGENLTALKDSKDDAGEIKRILKELKDNEATITSEDAAQINQGKTADMFGFSTPQDSHPDGVDKLGFPKPQDEPKPDSFGFPKIA
jgi:hypothetical protein